MKGKLIREGEAIAIRYLCGYYTQADQKELGTSIKNITQA